MIKMNDVNGASLLCDQVVVGEDATGGYICYVFMVSSVAPGSMVDLL